MADFKARPTTYKGIQMRSRLEAGYAMWLDETGIGWEYEPVCFASEQGQYLPDFRIDVPIHPFEGECTVYIEVKPTLNAVDWAVQRSHLAIIQATDRKAFLAVAVADVVGIVATLYLVSLDDDDRPADLAWVTTLGDDRKPKPMLCFSWNGPPWQDGYWKPRTS